MTDTEAELDCVQLGALLRPLRVATLVVRGEDRLSWLNGLVTCELKDRQPGSAVYGLIVAKNGKLESEIFVVVAEDRLYVSLREDAAERILGDLDRHLVMEDCELELDLSYRWTLALGVLADAAVHAAREAAAMAGLTQRGGVPCGVLLTSAAENESVLGQCMGAARPCQLASEEGWLRVRVEHGIGEFGVDFDASNYPQEAALETEAVSFNKGCYLGQEAVFMLEKRGHVKKRLVQLMVDGPVAVGDTITAADGTETGVVSSVARRGGKELALGFVKYKHARAETELSVGKSSASVTHLLALAPAED